MRHTTGERVLTWRVGVGMRRRSQYLPSWGEKRVIISRGQHWFLACWTHREGYWITQWGPPGLPVGAVTMARCPHNGDGRMKRRTPAETGLPPVPLSSESKLFGKWPLIRQFMSDTAYDDGTPRTPGYLTWRNRGGSFEITVYDPDAGLRCAVRAMTIDDTWAAVELLLGAENAPWEVDQYLTDQLAKKKKKRA